VVGADVGHDLGAGEEFGVEFILQLVELLCGVSEGAVGDRME
jgi:hypothetical protein